MPCPMRVVYATAIAAIIGSVAVYEAYKAGDDEAGGVGMGVGMMAKGFCSRLGAALHPKHAWAVLKKRPLILGAAR